MPVTSETSAPYTSQAVMLSLMERNREKGLPNPLTTEQLQRLGVPDSLVPRTLQALKTLDLIKEGGEHTDVLDRLRRAPEAEYKPLMAEWLRGAYAHALDVIDPATADEVAIRDAFRHYSPISMQPRMITLFTSLFEAAGVRAPEKAKPAPKKSTAAPSRPSPRFADALREAARQARLRQANASGAASGDSNLVLSLPSALAGMLNSLPNPAAGWTQEERDRFMIAFGAVLDFAIPIRTAPQTVEVSNASA
jgi:Family of unknown function (DUF5343)